MVLCVDHIDIKASNLAEAEALFAGLGMQVIRRIPAPRNSVEMALPGEGQVVFEIKQTKNAEEKTGIAHVGFRISADTELSALEEAGVAITVKDKPIADTGRVISNIDGFDGTRWQLTRE